MVLSSVAGGLGLRHPNSFGTRFPGVNLFVRVEIGCSPALVVLVPFDGRMVLLQNPNW